MLVIFPMIFTSMESRYVQKERNSVLHVTLNLHKFAKHYSEFHHLTTAPRNRCKTICNYTTGASIYIQISDLRPCSECSFLLDRIDNSPHPTGLDQRFQKLK